MVIDSPSDRSTHGSSARARRLLKVRCCGLLISAAQNKLTECLIGHRRFRIPITSGLQHASCLAPYRRGPSRAMKAPEQPAHVSHPVPQRIDPAERPRRPASRVSTARVPRQSGLEIRDVMEVGQPRSRAADPWRCHTRWLEAAPVLSGSADKTFSQNASASRRTIGKAPCIAISGSKPATGCRSCDTTKASICSSSPRRTMSDRYWRTNSSLGCLSPVSDQAPARPILSRPR